MQTKLPFNAKCGRHIVVPSALHVFPGSSSRVTEALSSTPGAVPEPSVRLVYAQMGPWSQGVGADVRTSGPGQETASEWKFLQTVTSVMLCQ